MNLQVDSRAGLHGEPEPLAFLLGGARIDVLQVLDRWYGEDYCYFKIAASDGALYILRYSSPDRQWELTLFQAGRDAFSS